MQPRGITEERFPVLKFDDCSVWATKEEIPEENPVLN
jgi:hypothetical protein